MDNKIVKAFFIVLAVIGAIVLLGAVVMGVGCCGTMLGGGMMGGMVDGMMSGMIGRGALSILLLLAIFAAIIGLIVFLVRRR